MRTVSRGLPIVVFLGVTLAAVMVSQPWDDRAQEAEAGPVEHRLCNTVLEVPPLPKPLTGARDIVTVSRVVEHEIRGEAGRETVELFPRLKIRLRAPSTATDGERRTVSIDPVDSTVAATDGLVSPKLQPVLDTVRHEPFDRSNAPWPYTDNGRPAERTKYGSFQSLGPNPASGIVVSTIYGMAGDGSPAHALVVANCESIMFVTAEFSGGKTETGIVADTRFVQPEDKAAFEEFLGAMAPTAEIEP